MRRSLENKVLQKLKFSENVNSKKCAPQMIFFKKKKLKDLDNSRRRKLNLKVRILQTADNQR